MSDFYDVASKRLLDLVERMADESGESIMAILWSPDLRDRLISQSDGVVVETKASPHGVSKTVLGSDKYWFANLASCPTSQTTFAGILAGALKLLSDNEREGIQKANSSRP